MSGQNVSYINRSLNTVLTELDFLRESEVITPALYQQLAEKLPRTYTPGAPKIDAFPLNNVGNRDEKSALAIRANAPASGPPPPSAGHGGEVAEALYHFQPSGPTDLQLFPGQRIQIVEKLNQDWWRGKDLQSSQEGIFPSNYVRIVSGGPGMGDPRGQVSGPPPYNAAAYQPPQQPYYPPQQQQQPFPPPSTSYYQQPPPQQQQVVQQEDHHVSDGVKKFGSKLGNAAIFGAGATIGSDLINSIF